jgi:lipoate-protein ligase A
MALDAWMQQQLASGAAGPMLRLYRWSRPTLSLGVHQRRLESHWPALEAAGVITSVRRPSGGRAVLHAGELTYALVCRPASTRRLEAYGQACRWLQEAFADLGLPLRFGGAAALEAHRRSSCFASAAAADLVEPSGAKRIGSAQLWRGPCLLQHGSVLLDPPDALWRELFSEDPPPLSPLPCTEQELEQRLRAAAEHHLCDGPLIEQPLSEAEWQAVLAGRSAYDSPLDCIERATAGSAIPRG